MAGFMSGFGTTLANSIEQDREYYREAASKRRDYLQTYGTKAVVDREDKANAAMGVVNTLKSRGFDTDTLRFTVDTAGVQGLLELDDATKNRDDLSKEAISRIVEVSKDYVKENPDMDLQQVISRAYGLYKSTDNPAKRETNIFAAVLGLDSGLAEDEVLDDIYVNGFTGRDIYRIMGSSGPKAKGALDYTVPKKPLPNATLQATARHLDSRFQASVQAEINSLQTKGAQDGGVTVADTNRIKYLQTLQGMGTQGMSEWMKVSPSFMADVTAFEDTTPGAITNNPYLKGLGLAYEAGPSATDSTSGDGETLNTNNNTATDTVTLRPITQYKTSEALAKAISEGEHSQGDRVQVGDGNVQSLQLPKAAAVPVDEDNVLSSSSINPLTATGSTPVTPEAIESSQELATAVENMSAVEREAFESVYNEVEESLVLSDLDLPGVTDTAAGKAVGSSVWVLGALRTASAKLANFFTDNTALTTERVLKGKELQEQGVELMADGFLEALKNRNNEQSNDLIAAAEAITPEDIARIKAKLIKSEALKAAVKEAEETALSGGTREAYGDYFSLTGNKTSDAPDPAVNAQRAVAQQPVRLPGETPQEFMIRTGNKFESTPAIKADNGPTAEQGLMSKRLDDTNRRISEEDAAMGVDYPQPLDTVTINGPTSEERLMDMPVKPSNELMSVVKSLAGANDEEKLEILSKYIGEDGLPIFGPNYAAERLADTNRRVSEEDAAMAVALPQPLQEILIKVEAALGSELAGALATGYQQVTMGSTELNTPSILAALAEVEEELGPEATEVLIESFIPATMSATELNTPAIKAALAKMPARNRANGQTVINAYLTSGVKFKNEAQAKAWIQKNFKGANISKNIVKSLSKILSNDSNK